MKVFVADNIAPEGVEYLRQQNGLEVIFKTGLSEAEVCDEIVDAEALIVRSAVKVTPAVIAAAPKLRVIGRAGIGVDNIDVDCATERGIVVLNTPDANATTTAELAIAHMFSLSRNLPEADHSVRSGKWERSGFMGAEISGKTIGIIGYGTIGRIVASRCLGLKMRVLAYDPFVTKEVFEAHGVESMELEAMLAQVDYLTLHCPLIEKTRGIINAERITMMKPGARVINCARGGLIDEDALLAAIENGHLAGAALDVFASEPPKNSPLLKNQNIVFTPHLGASTEEAQVAVGVAISRQIADYLIKGEAVNALNVPFIPSEELNKVRPYQRLAACLGKLLAALASSPVEQLEIILSGRAAEVEPRPIAVEAMVGLLSGQLSQPVNSVNACHLAKRQGITLIETRDESTHDYVSLISVRGTCRDRTITIKGTLLGESHPRLVQIDEYEIEAVPEGTLLITRHDDRPGVVGALGDILGQAQVNISRMHVGNSSNDNSAIAIIGISAPLDEKQLTQVTEIPAIQRVWQLSL